MRKTPVALLATLSILAALAILGAPLPAAEQPRVAAPPSVPAANQPALSAAAAAEPGCGQTLARIPAPAGSPTLDAGSASALPGRAAGRGEPSGPLCGLDETAAALGSKPFHGFCKCSCSFIPDCNTSADCGGAACIHAITCC